MNKQIRNELKFLKYKKRIQKVVANCWIYINRDGEYIYHPKTNDIIKDKGKLIYKTSSVACSCWMCSGSGKYERHKQKKENYYLIQEGLNEWHNKLDL